jgi:hypothetical protein
MEQNIRTLDGVDYDGPPGLEALLNETAPAYGTRKTIEITDGRGTSFGTGEFIYLYTALTTVVVGGAVQIDYTGYTGTAAYYGPLVTLPATTNIPHIVGIATKTMAAAGGLWVQVSGVCLYARVDGATNVALGTHLKVVNTAQYFTTDHATVETTAGSAIYLGCRHGAAGTTAWTDTAVDGTSTYPFPTLTDWPFYQIEETIAYNAQGNTTHGDPACAVLLLGKPSIVA